MSNRKEGLAWGTAAESQYLDGIGNSLKGKPVSLINLLKGYLKGCERRTDWAGIDRAVILQAARAKLAAAQGMAHGAG